METRILWNLNFFGGFIGANRRRRRRRRRPTAKTRSRNFSDHLKCNQMWKLKMHSNIFLPLSGFLRIFVFFGIFWCSGFYGFISLLEFNNHLIMDVFFAFYVFYVFLGNFSNLLTLGGKVLVSAKFRYSI